MERQLASVQRIDGLQPIEGADSIEVASILGWKVVVKKGVFKVGDQCIYFEIDSFLPAIPTFSFLNPKGAKELTLNGKTYLGHRLKTIKLRGQISQGLAITCREYVNALDELGKTDMTIVLDNGMDVTDYLDVVKWEAPISAQLAGVMKGTRPDFVPKTDEIRIQAVPWILEKYKGIGFYVTEKLDGSSISIYKYNGEFGVCSRNMDLIQDESSTMWKTATRLGFTQEALEPYPDFVLQGEIVGPGIQKNPMGLSEHDIYFYDIFWPDIREYGYFNQLRAICQALNVKVVPVVKNFFELKPKVEEMVEYAEQATKNEGLVIRPIVPKRDEKLGRLSFKVIRPSYLLKHDA